MNAERNAPRRAKLQGNYQTYLATEMVIFDRGVALTGFEFAAKRAASFHVLTAWNPGDARPTDVVNRAQNVILRGAIEELGHTVIPATGKDQNSDHAEESWAVVGLTDEEAMALGRRFGQMAVFRITSSRQTVLGCFDNWQVSRGRLEPLGVEGAITWLRDPKNHDRLGDLVDRYFGLIPGELGYEGRQFEWFARPSIDGFVADDFLAIGALSVRVPATTARKLIEDPRRTLSDLVRDCRTDAEVHAERPDLAWLWREEGPFGHLFQALNRSEYPGVGRVIRSKLLATKFPAHVPIRDTRVEKLLALSKSTDWWEPLHYLLANTRQILNDLGSQKSLTSVTPLRLLDAILWLESTDRGFD